MSQSGGDDTRSNDPAGSGPARSIARGSQLRVLAYSGGRLGVTAAPGAGKTHVLSALAARIISEGWLRRGQEVLVVTMVNSAVENFRYRIGGFLSAPVQRLNRFRVRTLHGLAHDIVRERPGLVGLDDKFSILDEHECGMFRQDALRAWLSSHPGGIDGYLREDLRGENTRPVRIQDISKLLDEVSLAFIRSAKDRRLLPPALQRALRAQPLPLDLAAMCTAIYADYQHTLAYRGAVDFDDLIRLALDLLEADVSLLDRLKNRFPFVLEDEAQDSSLAQEGILRLLTGEDGNWVRVGDPNQAIYETFTTASPELLRAFIRENPFLEMPESGRSQPAIIQLANRLIEWTLAEHPTVEARNALSLPLILPVHEDDPQPNPPAAWDAVRMVSIPYTAAKEVQAIVASIARWLPENPDRTVAVLVPRNSRGTEMITALRNRGIEAIELLSSTADTRHAVGALAAVLAYLAEPTSAQKLASAYAAWLQTRAEGNQAQGSLGADASSGARRQGGETATETRLRRGANLEIFLASDSSRELQGAEPGHDATNSEPDFERFQAVWHRWLDACVLPVDQLALVVAQDLFRDAADLALAHKLASLLRRAADAHRDWRLAELTQELELIARNERRFLGLSARDTGFDADAHRGKVVVATMHKSKGLEWDRVYLASVNSYDFPPGGKTDTFQAERWFIRDRLNLEAEALEQLSRLLPTAAQTYYEEGRATERARIDYVRERLRLLYVGITRARRELIITWNSGKSEDVRAAAAFTALWEWRRGEAPQGADSPE